MKRFFCITSPLIAFGLLIVAAALHTQAVATTPPITVPPNFTQPEGQASNLAVPPTAAPAPSSVMAFVYCNKISGLAIIDTEGTIHPVNIEGMKSADVMKIMQMVPADRVKSANLGCPGNPSKDTTVL